MSLPSSLLILNGFVVLLIGLLCGAPLGRAINRHSGEETIRAWRVAHSSLVNGGIMLLVISVVLPHVALSAFWQFVAAALLSIALYAFSYALVFGAWKKYRGLRKEMQTAANSVYYANMVGAVLSLVTICALAYGSLIALIKHLPA